jgi:zinc and cadmium transporter
MHEPTYIVASLLVASLLSASGAVLIVFGSDRLDEWEHYLVSLSIGAILGGAFIHLVPRYAEDFGLTQAAGLVIVLSIVGSYALGEAVHWHCHRHCEFEAFSVTLVVGDSIHNVLDGIIVSSSYYAPLPVGIAATAAVMLHKVPKEVGDFGVLLQGGVPRWRAVEVNVLTNVFAFLGAGAVIFLADVRGVIELLLPLAIGNFIYVAGADLLTALGGC